MTRWRLTVVLLVVGVIGVPAVLPFLELFGSGAGWQAWGESGRLRALALNTLLLVSGTLILAMPAGIVGAILLYRTDLPFRRGLRFLVILTLFVPLPLFTSAWQAALGTGGWLPSVVWKPPLSADSPGPGNGWQPWALGLDSAIWVQAVAGLPWVIVLVGQGLCWVEPELEEDALTVAGPWRVLAWVSLPRSLVSICAAALWIALMAMNEITVTDAMQVRTFAEEVYIQFAPGDRGALSRAVAVSLPAVVVTCALVVGVTLWWQRTLPPRDVLLAPPRSFPLGAARWPCLAAVLLAVGVLVGVPVASLIWKAGLAGNPEVWSAPVTVQQLAIVLRVRGGMILTSLFLAAVSGFLAASLGLAVCWLAVGSRWFQFTTLGLLALVWALSGPIVGLGLKETIAAILNWTGFYPLAVVLYYGPSPVPALWAHLLRFFPCAVAVLWPIVRLLPPEMGDAARVDGAGPRAEMWHVVLPLTWIAFVRAALAVAVLSLGELSAGKLVETPGSRTFAHEVFDQMHFGVSNDLAALCLVLLAAVVLGGALWQGVSAWFHEYAGE
jgi:iron(III) transport system permease protein